MWRRRFFECGVILVAFMAPRVHHARTPVQANGGGHVLASLQDGSLTNGPTSRGGRHPEL
jgi:hypothetical protein